MIVYIHSLKKSCCMVLAMVLSVMVSLDSAYAASADAPQKVQPQTFIELHWLRNGQSGNDRAISYINTVNKIAARHHAKLLEVSQVGATLKGTLAPAFVWMYEFRDANAMNDMMQDAEYTANIPVRNEIWDFDKNELFSVSRVLKKEAPLSPRSGWMNFVELHWASDAASAEQYVHWIQPLAKKHNGEVAQVFKVEAAVHGTLHPGYIWIYRFRNEAAMQALMTDPEYVSRIPQRNQIWDFEKNQLFSIKTSAIKK